jgi:NADH-quinone oxidoreductase subunit F
MENDPHALIEGMTIGAFVVDARKGFIYIRGEYRYQIECMDRAIAEAYERGWLGKNIQGTGFDFDVYTHTGAGAYECGEETALLDSIEGKRGIPRLKPPFPAVSGAWQSPTLLNNVETFCSIPPIIRDGGAAFAALGTPKNGGTRLVCLSGHVNKPGVYEIPLGYNMLKFIDDFGGGMRGGKKLKAVVPGGSSCPLLKADECDIAMDYDTLAKVKSMLGSGGMVVLDEDTCMVKFALRIMRFYAHESCGWCIPCREGTTWLRKILQRMHDGGGIASDIPLLSELSNNMLGRTFCALGDAAAMPTISIVEKWRDEFEDHLTGVPCPHDRARELAMA